MASGLAWGAMTLGCNKERAEVEQILAGDVASYAQLKPKVADLQRTYAELHEGSEELPEAPGGAEARAKLLTAEEVLGVQDAKLRWLVGEIDKAKQSGKKEDAVQLREEIANTDRDLAEVRTVGVELAHETVRLRALAAVIEAARRKAEAYKRVLSTGFEVKAPVDGIEPRLIAFIEDPKQKVDRTTWFDFDRVLFEGDGALLDVQKSRLQLDNVSQILNAYPAVKVKIGAFTDNSRPATVGKKLTSGQAEAVKAALVQMSVKPARLAAEGYGSQNPVCPANEDAPCRSRNRRVAVHVTAK
ncbi:MAG TPA: OmpA family protein [Polyangia bacterium]